MIYDPNALPPWDNETNPGPLARQEAVRRNMRNKRRKVYSTHNDLALWEANGNRWVSRSVKR
jgi:hypothetical protein